MCICERVHTHTYRLFYANDLYRLNRVPVYCIRRHSTHWWCIHGSTACVTVAHSGDGVGTDVLISVWFVWWCHARVTHDIHSCVMVDINRRLSYIHIVRICMNIQVTRFKYDALCIYLWYSNTVVHGSIGYSTRYMITNVCTTCILCILSYTVSIHTY